MRVGTSYIDLDLVEVRVGVNQVNAIFELIVVAWVSFNLTEGTRCF